MCVQFRYFVLFSTHIIFFFKQKTAYEMRISDWSSDVCSSDLGNWPKAISICSRHAGGTCRSNIRATTRSRGEPVCSCESGNLGSGPILCGSGLLQIGRASCRERVCQYV